MEATIILAKCKNGQTYGMRTQKMEDGDWWRTWAFPISGSRAKSEGYDLNVIKGNLYSTEKYNGCPYCKGSGFVVCGKCKKLTCYNGEEALTCQWCGNYMSNFQAATDKFELSGGDI